LEYSWIEKQNRYDAKGLALIATNFDRTLEKQMNEKNDLFSQLFGLIS